ncbi:hypothetical protein UA08_03975 [Talaromyces atroroseus]|uniref:RING-type domain-containing protein n=1 Tax=Talaromyces atroroseus TaxID=1441469 RepID=A0A1Q5Q8I4_TALAT|nr:hypothetical protein UA08_03975 [Talaromyces atroroseus]OKL60421.1 hypothetical protein UA08_03975 [Talaromyces atroroseus]
MASTELSQSLLDIISSLAQDDIPFKLRCAICNKLAINAFRLPCCDQAICESCQTSLPDSCPVCDHNPVSPDLCKPNKALRTTLKAFLRTEEKKREKDRASITPAVSVPSAPVTSLATEAHDESTNKASDNVTHTEAAQSESAPVIAVDEPSNDQQEIVTKVPVSAQENEETAAPTDENEVDNAVANDTPADVETPEEIAQSDTAVLNESNQVFPNAGFGMAPGMMPSMGWSGQGFSAISQFMPNAMGNFQNPMGLPGMGPMAAAQGMFGGYGMNMNNMSNGMNMGFGAEQQMYNNWDNSHNNMYNPTAYSNGMGQNYGTSGYAGYMSQHNGNYSQMQQYPNQNYHNGYYGNGPGYMRGMGRGRGRGYYRGRGGYDGHVHANYYQQNSVSQGTVNNTAAETTEDDPKTFNDELAPGGESGLAEDPLKDSTTLLTGPDDGESSGLANPLDRTDKPSDSNNPEQAAKLESSPSHLQGIPTIDIIDSAPSQPKGYSRGPFPVMDQGYGRGRGYNRGGFISHRGGFHNANNIQGPPAGQGVVGAPVAPRAMREGLPNTSTRGRSLGSSGRTALNAGNDSHSLASATPTTMQENVPPQSPSVPEPKSCSPSPSKEDYQSGSRAQSPIPKESRHYRDHRRDRSESAYGSGDDRETRKDRQRRSRREDREDRSLSRSPSQIEDSRRSSHRPDKDRDRKSSHRSYRSRRHRSRSDSRHRGRDSALEADGADKYDLASRIANAQRLSKGTSSHRRESKARKRDHQDRDNDRDYDRDRDRERRRDREREKHRDKRHERDREKDRKRSRRDRSPSQDDSDSSRRQSRRSKRSHRDDYDNERERDRPSTKPGGVPSKKDPHTLEREARNRERMVKEQQRRDAMTTDRDSKSSRRQHERNLTGGRRLNYKYEGDDDDMSRIEEEREASRWA